MMWFIQMYMQFGCFALDEIIHVSDQPVAPSFGSMVSTGTFSPTSTFAWYLPRRPDDRVAGLEGGDAPSSQSDQYSPMISRCCFSRSIAAWNWSSSSAYGFLIPRSGFVFIR